MPYEISLKDLLINFLSYSSLNLQCSIFPYAM
uniref:Uncharacterized protein n=1 Tax=Rhizophora mucronata TaxID=61149 RepID=A0A2P2QXI3_RHIMU